MLSKKFKAALVAAVLIFAPVIVLSLPQTASAAEATCYVADENGDIVEPKRVFTGTSDPGFPEIPSPVNPGHYTLEAVIPAFGVDTNGDVTNIVCDVFYNDLGKIQLVTEDGTVVASKIYDNDPTNPSLAGVTHLPDVPEGYKLVAGQTVFGYNEANAVVDPNNPADPDAIGNNTILRVEKL